MIPQLVLFSPVANTGVSSLAYHCAHRFAAGGLRVLAVDLGPQCHLTRLALGDDFWESGDGDPIAPASVHDAVAPLWNGGAELAPAEIRPLDDGLGLVAGDIALAAREEMLAGRWAAALGGDPDAWRIVTALREVIDDAARRHQADLVIVDTGPELGALNRSIVCGASHLVLASTLDSFSLRAWEQCGPLLNRWRHEWHGMGQCVRLGQNLPFPNTCDLTGLVLLQPSGRNVRRPGSSELWKTRLVDAFASHVGGLGPAGSESHRSDLIYCLRSYQSLADMAWEARKPMFALRSADGAVGSYAAHVTQCYDDYTALTRQLAARLELANVS